ncbi:hypothetical protein SAMN04244567_04176 [Paracoccus pantotrophus]|nr:hypothetical protein SAMN04244567_04176 [Paracoccus pantotrophus]
MPASRGQDGLDPAFHRIGGRVMAWDRDHHPPAAPRYRASGRPPGASSGGAAAFRPEAQQIGRVAVHQRHPERPPAVLRAAVGQTVPLVGRFFRGRPRRDQVGAAAEGCDVGFPVREGWRERRGLEPAPGGGNLALHLRMKAGIDGEGFVSGIARLLLEHGPADKPERFLRNPAAIPERPGCGALEVLQNEPQVTPACPLLCTKGGARLGSH